MLTKAERMAIIARAHIDKTFRDELLKELLRMAIASDPELLEKAVAKVESKTK